MKLEELVYIYLVQSPRPSSSAGAKAAIFGSSEITAVCGLQWLTFPVGPRCAFLEPKPLPAVTGGRRRRSCGLWSKAGARVRCQPG